MLVFDRAELKGANAPVVGLAGGPAGFVAAAAGACLLLYRDSPAATQPCARYARHSLRAGWARLAWGVAAARGPATTIAAVSDSREHVCVFSVVEAAPAPPRAPPDARAATTATHRLTKTEHEPARKMVPSLLLSFPLAVTDAYSVVAPAVARLVLLFAPSPTMAAMVDGQNQISSFLHLPMLMTAVATTAEEVNLAASAKRHSSAESRALVRHSSDLPPETGEITPVVLCRLLDLADEGVAPAVNAPLFSCDQSASILQSLVARPNVKTNEKDRANLTRVYGTRGVVWSALDYATGSLFILLGTGMLLALRFLDDEDHPVVLHTRWKQHVTLVEAATLTRLLAPPAASPVATPSGEKRQLLRFGSGIAAARPPTFANLEKQFVGRVIGYEDLTRLQSLDFAPDARQILVARTDGSVLAYDCAHWVLAGAQSHFLFRKLLDGGGVDGGGGGAQGGGVRYHWSPDARFACVALAQTQDEVRLIWLTREGEEATQSWRLPGRLPPVLWTCGSTKAIVGGPRTLKVFDVVSSSAGPLPMLKGMAAYYALLGGALRQLAKPLDAGAAAFRSERFALTVNASSLLVAALDAPDWFRFAGIDGTIPPEAAVGWLTADVFYFTVVFSVPSIATPLYSTVFYQVAEDESLQIKFRGKLKPTVSCPRLVSILTPDRRWVRRARGATNDKYMAAFDAVERLTPSRACGISTLTAQGLKIKFEDAVPPFCVYYDQRTIACYRAHTFVSTCTRNTACSSFAPKGSKEYAVVREWTKSNSHRAEPDTPSAYGGPSAAFAPPTESSWCFDCLYVVRTNTNILQLTFFADLYTFLLVDDDCALRLGSVVMKKPYLMGSSYRRPFVYTPMIFVTSEPMLSPAESVTQIVPVQSRDHIAASLNGVTAIEYVIKVDDEEEVSPRRKRAASLYSYTENDTVAEKVLEAIRVAHDDNHAVPTHTKFYGYRTRLPTRLRLTGMKKTSAKRGKRNKADHSPRHAMEDIWLDDDDDANREEEEDDEEEDDGSELLTGGWNLVSGTLARRSSNTSISSSLTMKLESTDTRNGASAPDDLDEFIVRLRDHIGLHATDAAQHAARLNLNEQNDPTIGSVSVIVKTNCNRVYQVILNLQLHPYAPLSQICPQAVTLDDSLLSDASLYTLRYSVSAYSLGHDIAGAIMLHADANEDMLMLAVNENNHVELKTQRFMASSFNDFTNQPFLYVNASDGSLKKEAIRLLSRSSRATLIDLVSHLFSEVLDLIKQRPRAEGSSPVSRATEGEELGVPLPLQHSQTEPAEIPSSPSSFKVQPVPLSPGADERHLSLTSDFSSDHEATAPPQQCDTTIAFDTEQTRLRPTSSTTSTAIQSVQDIYEALIRHSGHHTVMALYVLLNYLYSVDPVNTLRDLTRLSRIQEPLMSPFILFPLCQVNLTQAFDVILHTGDLKAAMSVLVPLQQLVGPTVTRAVYACELLYHALTEGEAMAARDVYDFIVRVEGDDGLRSTGSSTSTERESPPLRRAIARAIEFLVTERRFRFLITACTTLNLKLNTWFEEVSAACRSWLSVSNAQVVEDMVEALRTQFYIVDRRVDLFEEDELAEQNEYMLSDWGLQLLACAAVSVGFTNLVDAVLVACRYVSLADLRNEC